jgi:CheY-specific phosphatase CheX
MNDTTLLQALEVAMREAFSEMLPNARAELRENTDVSFKMGDAAVVALSGFMCGSLIVLTPRESTKVLADRIAGDLMGDDDGELAECRALTRLEQDSLREFSNRVGCIFAGVLTDAGKRLTPTFPIFVYGQDINVLADSDHRLGLAFLVDGGIRIEARVFLSVPKSSGSRAEQIRELERMRAALLADETK